MHIRIFNAENLYRYWTHIYIYLISNKAVQTVTFVKTAYKSLIPTVLILAIVSLIFEMLPEYESKILGIPTLILIIILNSFELFRQSKKPAFRGA